MILVGKSTQATLDNKGKQIGQKKNYDVKNRSTLDVSINQTILNIYYRIALMFVENHTLV